ncbi:type II toxin-antitoxin system PemK/MazF family toxin [uncultured Brevundimonas sp.]|uniref:type II toxin-antitoxin system PemK/MazF family toxin n=1 Tax=uncultured Brevundimonas sp. TaxID=213418 RepID=UPI00345C8508
MAITFHPKEGAILLCDYGTGFIEPEMVKQRLCVVISPRLRRREGLCNVVPLSTTAPRDVCDYHCDLELERELPRPWAGRHKWAKCDLFAAVSHKRLSLIGTGRGPDGSRKYIQPHVSHDQLKAIKGGVLCALTLQRLTEHL